jgi:hypothetical protein
LSSTIKMVVLMFSDIPKIYPNLGIFSALINWQNDEFVKRAKRRFFNHSRIRSSALNAATRKTASLRVNAQVNDSVSMRR